MSKQYLMMVNDDVMEFMKRIYRGSVEFLEVQGMNMGGTNEFKILVAPVIPPVACMPMPTIPDPEAKEQPSGESPT